MALSHSRLFCLLFDFSLCFPSHLYSTCHSLQWLDPTMMMLSSTLDDVYRILIYQRRLLPHSSPLPKRPSNIVLQPFVSESCLCQPCVRVAGSLLSTNAEKKVCINPRCNVHGCLCQSHRHRLCFTSPLLFRSVEGGAKSATTTTIMTLHTSSAPGFEQFLRKFVHLTPRQPGPQHCITGPPK